MRPDTRRGMLAVAVLVAVAFLGLAVTSLYAATARTASAASSRTGVLGPDPRPQPWPSGAATSDPQGTDHPVDLEQHLDRMRQLGRLNGATRQPLITGGPASQPDLFAGEFVRRLFTQDYNTPRADLLAWVQAESTPVADPLVVGLVPSGLRDRFAVYSVTDTSDGPSPVPTAPEWAALTAGHATTTVRIDRVLEPDAWSNAVQAGRITDPGTTARLVAATLTRHTGEAGRRGTETFSVAVSLNLEGPPTRADWRFVTAVTYTVVPLVGAS